MVRKIPQQFSFWECVFSGYLFLLLFSFLGLIITEKALFAGMLAISFGSGLLLLFLYIFDIKGEHISSEKHLQVFQLSWRAQNVLALVVSLLMFVIKVMLALLTKQKIQWSDFIFESIVWPAIVFLVIFVVLYILSGCFSGLCQIPFPTQIKYILNLCRAFLEKALCFLVGVLGFYTFMLRTFCFFGRGSFAKGHISGGGGYFGGGGASGRW